MMSFIFKVLFLWCFMTEVSSCISHASFAGSSRRSSEV